MALFIRWLHDGIVRSRSHQAGASPFYRHLISHPFLGYSGAITPVRNEPMHPLLQQAYEAELTAAVRLYHTRDLDLAFSHLERAHILGQSYNAAHARTHWWMLKIGWCRRDMVEIIGQVLRIPGALLFSKVWVPVGNTGGAHVSGFKPMPLPDDLRIILEKYGPGPPAL